MERTPSIYGWPPASRSSITTAVHDSRFDTNTEPYYTVTQTRIPEKDPLSVVDYPETKEPTDPIPDVSMEQD